MQDQDTVGRIAHGLSITTTVTGGFMVSVEIYLMRRGKGKSMVSKMVLVVDDDQSILDFINEALTDEGYDVVTASDTEAVQAAHDKHPDVILLDIQMPTLDGVEISRRLRAENDTADIPIIVMSARDRLDATVSSMPVNDQLVKPFPLRALYDAVATWSA